MLHAVLGEAGLLALAWAFSESRWAVRWRTVAAGIALQVALGVLLTRFPPAIDAILLVNRAATAVQTATATGTAFVFGYLGGGHLPFAPTRPGAGFILAFQALPLVLVISALASLLFHWGVMQRVTAGFAWVLRRTMGLGGALALGAAVHVFVGMVEAPLLVRPYLARMSRGELFALMSCGMAGVAGTVMVIYAAFLAHLVPDALGQILTASVISTPAAVAVAAVMVPFEAGTAEDARLEREAPSTERARCDRAGNARRSADPGGYHRGADRRDRAGGADEWNAGPAGSVGRGGDHPATDLRDPVPPGDVADRHSLARDRRRRRR